MKNVQTTTEKRNVYLQYAEDLRSQGSRDFHKIVFYAFCVTVALCVSVMMIILSDELVSFVEDKMKHDMQIWGVVLLSPLVMCVAVYFLRMCLSLWRMTKED